MTAKRARPPRLHSRWVAAIIGVCAVALVAGSISLAPPPSVAAVAVPVVQESAEAPQVRWPQHAQAAGFALANAPETAQQWGRDDAVPMASLAKIVTVLVVLDEHEIAAGTRGARITLGPGDVAAAEDARDAEAPVMDVFAGDVVDQATLVEWALVRSAANAAWSLAMWAFGSMDEFLTATEAYLAAHGLDDTAVTEPSGLARSSVSTAADLVALGLLAVEDPVVMAAMRLPHVAVASGEPVPNTNRLLGRATIDAGKTGTLYAWGRNLLVSATRIVDGQHERFVAVVLGVDSAERLDADTVRLVYSLWEAFAVQTVVPAGTRVFEYRAPWGSHAFAVTERDVTLTAFPGVVWETRAEAEPIAADQLPSVVGSLALEGVESVQVPLVLEGEFAGPDGRWRWQHPRETIGWLLTAAGLSRVVP